MKTKLFNIAMVSLGCPKNQVDGEKILHKISEKEENYNIISDPFAADIVIINTCGFIEDAKKESIDYILQYCNAKEEGSVKKVIVSGCLAQRYKDEIKEQIPEVDAVIGIGSNNEIVDALDCIINKNEQYLSFKPKENLDISGLRFFGEKKHYAYLKISEGCDNSCSFCAIPSIRGKLRSRKIEEIVKEAEFLCENGVKEIIIVSQDTTMYGNDIYKSPQLPKLLNALCKIEGLKWLRIMYCYPNTMTDDILQTIKNQPKIVKYLEMPIQHVDASILKAMNRGGNVEFMSKIMKKIRSTIPNIALRTSFIVGFPGETDENFATLHHFIKDFEFDRMGCFIYSKEEGTRAFDLECQIDEDVKQNRLDLIMNEQMFIMEKLNKKKVGTVLQVIIDEYSKEDKLYIGRTQYDAPSIDGCVLVKAENLKIGEIYNVFISGTDKYDLKGEPI